MTRSNVDEPVAADLAPAPAALEETFRLVQTWNRTGRDYPRDLCLHQLFESAADRSPGNVALIDGTLEVTYAELERRANQVAHHLRRLGAGPEKLVGICTSRSADMIIGMFGALKAGAAYLSLDPAYPRERLAFMLEDAAAPVVLTQERLLDRFPEGGPAIVCLDRDAERLAAESPERLPPAAGPRSLAYAIYTSGSTGRPKGVAIEHRSAAVLCHWAREIFPAEDLAGMLASTSINFDLSVFEIFVPLAWGGTVIVAENALALPRLPAAGRVRFVNTVPSAMAELVRAQGLPPSVRTVGLAGEPLKGVLAERIYATGAVRGVYNLYGPSEDTTYSTWVRVERGSPDEPTIGRPIANTELYLLGPNDPGLPMVPVGEPGEVYLGGEGLARGYLGRPELTAERFLPDPFSGRSGDRLYRVGDLGRFLPNGEVQFLGRVDHQVKIRGFRIELGEIDAALSRHPAVGEAVVAALVAPGEDGDRRLVAYVEPLPGQPAPAAASLRSYLRERLPGHFVPSVFVLLDTLPRTPNGKVDRKALPEPDWSGAGGDEETAGPRNPLEELVAGLWSEALGLARIGIHDHFLELGGHSLLAARLVSRMRDTLGVEIDLPTLFAHPTVAGCAAAVEQARSGGARALPPILPVPRSGGLRASLMQTRQYFLDQLQPGSPVNNIAIAAHLTGPLHPGLLARAIGEVIRRHEALRTTFEDRDGYVWQKIAGRADLRLPVIDCAALPDGLRTAERDRLSAERAAVPFDLRRGPVLRAGLLRLGPEEHRLLVVFHHIVSDDWSVWVFFRELSALYRAFLADAPPPFPAPPAIQYADFAAWQNAWLATPGVLDEFIAHARGLLTGVATLIDLPIDRPRPPIQTFKGRLRRFALPGVLADRLRGLSRREGATLFMALLAAFEIQMARWTGREQFLVGSPTAGRNRTEVEGLIGFFTNTAIWRADLAGRPDFRTLLRRVRTTVLEGSRFDALPFEQIPAELRIAQDTTYNPLLLLLFALQTVPRPEPEMAPGLHVHTWEMDTGTAKVEISFFLWDDEELTGAVEYSTDLFDESTILRLVGGYQRALEGVLAAPDVPAAGLDLLSASERWQILGEWNGTAPRHWVLDAALQPCPIGVTGDLYTGEIEDLRAVVPTAALLHSTGERARFTREGRLERIVEREPQPHQDGAGTSENPLEDVIIEIWEQVLGVSPVGRNQSFFALGGHSLLATQVIARLRDVLGVEIPFRTLFERATVAGLARAIQEGRRSSQLPDLQPGHRGDPPSLSFAQKRLWFLEKLDPGTAVFNIPVLYELRGPLETPVLHRALAEIVRRHEVLRTTLDTGEREEGIPRVHPPGVPELPLVDLSALPGARREEEADRATTAEARRPFDLERGPLVRFLLLRLDAATHRFLGNFHHLVSDGGSLPLFERELTRLYGAFAAGRPSTLPELPVQYGDYAAWQHRCLTGDSLEEQLAFWRQRLAGPLGAIHLPTDRPRPEVPSPRGALAQSTFPPELAAAVRELSRREGATLYMTLMAAFLALLHRATGERDLPLGTPVSLRDHSRLENLIGMFVNTLVIRTRVTPETSFRAHLRNVREQVLEAVAHQDIPFERLVDELHPERGTHDTPLFQLMFALVRQDDAAVRAGELELRQLALVTGTAQFELTLYMVDAGGELVALAEYRTELFDAATIDQMLAAFQTLLAAAVANPDLPLAELPLQGWPASTSAPAAPETPAPAKPSAQEADAARESQLAALRSELSDAQRELLRQRLMRKKS